MVYTMMIKYEIVKFDGKNDFNLWHVKMLALLVQQGVLKILQGSEAFASNAVR